METTPSNEGGEHRAAAKQKQARQVVSRLTKYHPTPRLKVTYCG